MEHYKNCNMDILMWHKINPMPSCHDSLLPDTEYCLLFKEKGTKFYGTMEQKGKWFVSPINVSDKKLYGHPTIKPLEFVKRHIANSTQPNDVVLDCFCGSGTTCVAAKELGRHYIGIEKDDNYYKIAVDRLNGITKDGQTSIFTDFDNL